MTQIRWHEPAGENERYEPGAFAALTGQRVPFRAYPGGPQMGWATVIDVTVDDDGFGATWTADVDLDSRQMIALAARSSFSFQLPPDDVLALIRDPLASKSLVIKDLPGKGEQDCTP